MSALAPDPATVVPAAAGLPARRAAYQAVRRVHADGAWSGPAVDAALRRSGLDARDRAFAANLAFSTLRWRATLDWYLAQVCVRPLDDVEPAVLDVLRLGAWQLRFGDVPDRAAVATTVDLATAEVGARATGFVNGVLRGLARQGERLRLPDGDDPGSVGLRLGYPAWIVSEARARFGTRADAVLHAGNVPPGLTLRAAGDPEALREELASAGLDVRRGRLAPEALRVAGGDPHRIPAVAEGRATVQDEASMVVTRTAAAGRAVPWRALDVCAAPGGKSTHLAQLGATAVAADLRPARARLVADAVARAGVAVPVVAADGTRPPWRARAFDAVVLDAPCTGLGVVRRRPELRWRRDPADVGTLAALQLRLLEASAGLVADDGTLTYSVCTWTEAETVGVVRQFLALHGDRFVADDTSAAAGVPAFANDDAGVQLDPDRHATDGMYLARFRTRASRR